MKQKYPQYTLKKITLLKIYKLLGLAQLHRQMTCLIWVPVTLLRNHSCSGFAAFQIIVNYSEKQCVILNSLTFCLIWYKILVKLTEIRILAFFCQGGGGEPFSQKILTSCPNFTKQSKGNECHTMH